MGIAIGRTTRRLMLALALVTACCAIEGALAFADDDDEVEPAEPKPEPPASKIKVFLAYGLAIGGFAVIAMGVARTVGAVSYQQSKLSMTNLLRTNPNQAEQVAKSVSGNYFEGLAAAMKLAAMAATRDPKTVQATTPPAYDAAAIGISMYWKGLLAKLKLAGDGNDRRRGARGDVEHRARDPDRAAGARAARVLPAARLQGGGGARRHAGAGRRSCPSSTRAIIEGRFWFPPPPG